jgi:NADPH-dependent ferric siderophore reductase
MIRILFEGPELDSFVSLAPDDHLKLFFPVDAGEQRRDYTPRRFDPVARTLAIDFALHDAGPATQWAIAARPGDVLAVGGPRGSAVIPHDFDWWLLIGDATALPAIGRRIEELPAGTRVISVVAVTGPEERQSFGTVAHHEARWVYRSMDRCDDPAAILAALNELVLPDGEGFVWAAAETSIARAVRAYFVEGRGHPSAWIKAAGYWKKGVADADEKSLG